jgi:hypothetical protein
MVKNSKKNKQIGKYGITGNSGLGVGGFVHVCMPYDSNGEVFVKADYREKLPNGKVARFEWWKRVPKNKAKEENIIRCNFCNKPAVRLDHLWPSYDEMNACEKHLEKYKKYLGKKDFPEKEKLV